MYDFGSGVKLCGVNYCRDFFLVNRWKNRKKRKKLIPQKFSATRFAKSFTMVISFDAQNFSRTFSKGDTIMLHYSLIKRKYISLLHWGMSEFSSEKNLLWWKGASLCLSPINLFGLSKAPDPNRNSRHVSVTIILAQSSDSTLLFYYDAQNNAGMKYVNASCVVCGRGIKRSPLVVMRKSLFHKKIANLKSAIVILRS